MKFIAKFLSSSILKRFLILTLLLILYISISAISYTDAVCADISENVFRLHVIANSDSVEDQNLKYIVRDSIINYINEISQNATSKDDVVEIAKKNLEEIQSIAQQKVKNLGYNYPVNVSVGNFAFPSKKYGDITLPPGYYDALKIEIGEAERSKLVVRNVPSPLFCRCRLWNTS